MSTNKKEKKVREMLAFSIQKEAEALRKIQEASDALESARIRYMIYSNAVAGWREELANLLTQ